jgi:hypothetical protein
MNQFWLVFRWDGPHEFEFVGLFDSCLKAMNACTTENHLIAPANLNENVEKGADIHQIWPGAFYPLLEDESLYKRID